MPPATVKGNSIGVNNPNWKGGEKRHAMGYILKYHPEHPHSNCGGYVRRARLVLEDKLGRYLSTSEVSHHCNGIKDDDNPDNLIAVSHCEHMRQHPQLNKPRDNKGRYIPVT